jgi:hypothetical protein
MLGAINKPNVDALKVLRRRVMNDRRGISPARRQRREEEESSQGSAEQPQYCHYRPSPPGHRLIVVRRTESRRRDSIARKLRQTYDLPSAILNDDLNAGAVHRFSRFTDFPLAEITLFFMNKTILLSEFRPEDVRACDSWQPLPACRGRSPEWPGSASCPRRSVP